MKVTAWGSASPMPLIQEIWPAPGRSARSAGMVSLAAIGRRACALDLVESLVGIPVEFCFDCRRRQQGDAW